MASNDRSRNQPNRRLRVFSIILLVAEGGFQWLRSGLGPLVCFS
jgi:hypothetical protein